MTQIKLKGLAKRFGTEGYSLQPTDLDIRDGEFLTFLGPSGCGKTTTLRMIAGLEEPSEGEIWFGDRRVDRIVPGQRNIAMVFQNYALYPHLTVRGNLEYPLKKRGIPKEQHASLVQRTAETLQIVELLERRPKQLSGGQQQRVALGRAMIREPNVFLFDEPLSNLDAQLRSVMRAELTRLHQTIGKTMLYVTHDQLEAMTMSDRIVILNRGEIQQVGTPDEIYHRPANRFVASFVGTPAMNFFNGVVNSDERGIFLQTDWGALKIVGDNVGPGRILVAGARPENIHVGEGEVMATVKLVENLGHETQLMLTVGNGDLTVRASPSLRASFGDRLPITFDMAGIHLFDFETGNRIARGN